MSNFETMVTDEPEDEVEEVEVEVEPEPEPEPEPEAKVEEITSEVTTRKGRRTKGAKSLTARTKAEQAAGRKALAARARNQGNGE